MPELWKPLAIGTYLHWIEDILEEVSDELSDWESAFISNIRMRLDRGVNLTEEQAKKLEYLYTEKTS